MLYILLAVAGCLIYGKFKKLREEIEELKDRIDQLYSKEAPVRSQTTVPTETAKEDIKDDIDNNKVADKYPLPQKHSQSKVAPEPTFASKAEETKIEHNLGVGLPVWIGGLALAFAGFFLIKYSIEQNLLSPPIRDTRSPISYCTNANWTIC